MVILLWGNSLGPFFVARASLLQILKGGVPLGWMVMRSGREVLMHGRSVLVIRGQQAPNVLNQVSH